VAFLKRNATYGHVLNSLPFYGSNGGVIVAPERSGADRDAIGRALVRGFRDVADGDDVIASTIVASPLAPLDDLYREEVAPTLEDERIGQLTALPALSSETSDAKVSQALLASHPAQARKVRKALRSSVRVESDGSIETMRALAAIHRDNMEAIGGSAKSWSVFEAIRGAFVHDVDYRVYRATVEGETVAALLVFFYGRVSEYFTPATLTSARPLQPSSLLVHTAMIDAVRRGCTTWNWGGTWTTQHGVRAFKASWGAEEIVYRYFVRERPGSELRSLDAQTLLRAYPNFYAIPFRCLEPRQ
jgi:hypothetical protein